MAFETFDNLPNVGVDIQDGGITFPTPEGLPVIMVLGTATAGPGDTPYAVTGKNPDAVKSVFGTDGTLIRGFYEVRENAGTAADAIKLYRIGATPATLTGVGKGGSAAGFTIETADLDGPLGGDTTVDADPITGGDTAASGVYILYQKDPTTTTNNRLRVYTSPDNGATFTVVYDNQPDSSAAGVDETYDLGIVHVTGTAGSGTDIGTANPLAPVLMAAVTTAGTVLTNGKDGTSMSRMEHYESLYKAFRNLENEEIDIVVPMNVYLDDANVEDLTDTEITDKALSSLTTYPTPGSTKDVLGKVYVQENSGKYYFWWDMNRDGKAEIFPTVGSSDATHNADGTLLKKADFHEVNFGYQLANFCFDSTENNVAMVGVIGVNPPKNASGAELNKWVGTLPVLTTNASGKSVVKTNGTGLLGNKFMSGRLGSSVTNLPSHTIGGVAGLADGGFIATTNGHVDGTQKKDANSHLVDIGKYISVVASYPSLANNWRTTPYVTSGAATYAGFFVDLPPQSAPTNKTLRLHGLPYRLNNTRLNDLTGQRYVTFRVKTKGVVVTDAPTAARPDSDYQRLTTFRIVKTILDDVRLEADPFLGEAGSASARAALETALERRLNQRKADGLIKRHAVSVTATPQQEFQNEATVTLELVPAFELRQITVVTSLAAL